MLCDSAVSLYVRMFPTVGKEFSPRHILNRQNRQVADMLNSGCEALFGYGDKDDTHTYLYVRKGGSTDIKFGTVILIPNKDYELLLLELPEFFTYDRNEYNYLDANNLFISHKGGSLVLKYAKFLSIFTNSRFAGLSDVSLKYWYTKFNLEHFGGDLPYDISVIWNNRASGRAGEFAWSIRGGACTKLQINISVKYHSRFSNEVLPTLLHEMIHVYYPRNKHGSLFQGYADYLTRKTGYEITTYSKGAGAPNWVYICNSCGTEVERVKRVRNLSLCYCSKCRGSLTEYSFDEWEELKEYA